jgi:hypothetical protein
MARAFVRKLGEKGWYALSWPKEYGGQGRPFIDQFILHEELLRNLAPAGGTGLTIVGPVVMAHGAEEQKREFLPRIARGEIEFNLGYSEPEFGSDLAGLQTRAVEDGDDYVINGQKIWTTVAHLTEYCWLAARTDPQAPKHKGISLFIVDMKTPGITVQPVINMLGVHSFNNVFFDDVRVPKTALVGTRDRGWYALASALDFERTPIYPFFSIFGQLPILEEMAGYAREATHQGQPLAKIPTVRHRLAELRVEIEAGRMMAYRVASMMNQGAVPNYEASMIKFYATELAQRLANLGMQLLGLYGQLEPNSPRNRLRGQWERFYLGSVGATIGAGATEVQRNIVAQRGLGLPRG